MWLLSLGIIITVDKTLYMYVMYISYACIHQWMTKVGGEEDNLRKAIDFKNKVMATLNKFQRLKVIYTNPPSSSSSLKKNLGEDGYDELAGKAKKPRPQATAPEWQFGDSYSSVHHSDMEQDPTTPEAQLARLKRRLDTKERWAVDDNLVLRSYYNIMILFLQQA
jgi:hypothetical protein